MTETNNEGTASDFEVLAFFAADHAVVENGKVYVNGGFFDRVYYPVYPAAPSSISVVGLVKVPAHQFLRDHQFVVELQREGGDAPVVHLEGAFRTLPAPDAGPDEPSNWPLAIPLTGLSLPRVGDYYFVLSINGNEVARYKIRAMQAGVIAQMPPQVPTSGSDEPQEEAPTP